jgi:hypothetical protein
MLTRIFALTFALLTVAAPAHAAFIDSWNGDVNLTYSFGQIVGTIDLTPPPAICCHGFYSNNLYGLQTNLTLNGLPLHQLGLGNISGGPGTEGDEFVSGSIAPFFGPFPIAIALANLPNLSFLDFAGATGGTVQVLSYTCTGDGCSAIPLPATGKVSS